MGRKYKHLSPITDEEIAALKPKLKRYKVCARTGNGLRLYVHPTGSKSWSLKYRIGGKEGQISYGLWPEVTLEEALQRVLKDRKLIRDEVVPTVARKLSRKKIHYQNKIINTARINKEILAKSIRLQKIIDEVKDKIREEPSEEYLKQLDNYIGILTENKVV